MKIEKLKNNLLYCIDNKVSKNDFENTDAVGIGYFSNARFALNKQFKAGEITEEKYNEIIDLYNKLDGRKKHEKLESENAIETYIERDTEHKISGYSFKIFKENRPPLIGNLTREEMNDIYHLYSYYGTNLTQREVSRHFPDMSLMDFKRVRNAFLIYKDSAPFAPHMIEEKSIDELRDIQLREKENDFLKKVEEDDVKNNKKLVREYALENIKLKQQLQDFSNIDLASISAIKPVKIENSGIVSDKSIMLHLSDLHIGAKCESDTVYENEWNEEICTARLNKVLSKLTNFGKFDTIVINLLGDMLDGMDGQTARRDHIMPQNMDNMQQVESFLRIMHTFIASMYSARLAKNIIIYSVKEGNHDGNFGNLATRLLLAELNAKYPDIQTKIFSEFFGTYEFSGKTFVITHGKDAKFMKRGLPANLDEKTKVRIYEWLNYEKIHADKVYFIKGDLHTENINSCNSLDYRNVLSLFGASDYSNYNFSRNQYGVSYELFMGDIMTRGTFENL